MADCERGLDRPERALELAHSAEAATLDADARIELLIVESGARADMGDLEAAVVVLQIPELDSPKHSPTLARLRFAYSEALNRAEREREAAAWRARAMDSDRDGTADLYPDDDEDILDLEQDFDDEDAGDDGLEGPEDAEEDRRDVSDGPDAADDVDGPDDVDDVDGPDDVDDGDGPDDVDDAESPDEVDDGDSPDDADDAKGADDTKDDGKGGRA
jgi:hypothetical protein